MTTLQQVWALTPTLALFMAPLPLASILALRICDRAIPGSVVLTATLAFWIATQACIAVLAGFLHVYNFAGIAVLELLTLVAWWRLRVGVRPMTLPLPRSHVEVLALGLITAEAIRLLGRCIAEPTENFDSLSYHLQHIASWVQAGGLDRLEMGMSSGYPFSWHAMSGMLFFPQRTDAFVSLPQWIAWIGSGLAILSAARLLGAPRSVALAAAVLFLLIPEVQARIVTVQPDLAIAYMLLVALNGVLLGWLGHQRAAVPLLLIPLGFVCGMRFTSALYAAGFLLAWLGSLRAFRPSWKIVVISSVVALALSAPWYIRNWVIDGSPLAQFAVRVGDMELVEGELSGARLSRTTILNVTDLTHAPDRAQILRVWNEFLGWPLTLLLAGSLLGVLQLRRRPRTPILVVWVLTLLSFFLYISSPLSASPKAAEHLNHSLSIALRYGYPWMGLLAVLFAAGWRGWPRLAGVTIALPWAALLLGPHRIWAVGVTLGLLLLRLAWARTPRLRSPRALLAWGIVCFATVMLAFAHWAEIRRQTWSERYEQTEAVLAKLPESATVHCLSRVRHYPLFGARLEVRVVFAPPEIDSAEALEGYLQVHDVQFVAIAFNKAKRDEMRWLRSSGFKILGWADYRTAIFERRDRESVRGS